MFFKGSNFYLQITHFYDFIQAWTDVTHFFKVSLENFPQSEHLYGFINMETLKFFQECSLTILNLYHKHKKGNSSKYELTVIFDSWIFNTTSNKMDTKLLFLIEFSCVLSKSKVIFDTWIFITNTKGTQRFPFWMNKNLICTAVTCFLKVATFINKLYTSMTLFKHELMLHTSLRCL